MRSRMLNKKMAAAVLCAAIVPTAAFTSGAQAGGKGGKGGKKIANARVTGGGSVFTARGVRVTHGFELRCDAKDKRQNLEINWEGSRFHLENLTAAYCFDDPNVQAGQPSQKKTAVDTYQGVGTGRYNGVSGATAKWVITDDGEPGTTDRFSIEVTAGGSVVLWADGVLDRGNHQFHFTN